MRVAVGFVVSVGTYLAVAWRLRGWSAVLWEIDRARFAGLSLFYALSFASGGILDADMIARWSWTKVLIDHVVVGVGGALLMLAGQWLGARVLRWARTGR